MVMKIKVYKTKIFKEGNNLLDFITSSVRRLSDGDIIVVTSKIVSLSEGRVLPMGDDKYIEKIIKKESKFAIKTKYVWLTIKDDMVLASAGIDKSNADGKIILLPRDSYKTAYDIRKFFMNKFKLKNLGVIISDSRTLPLRAGIVGLAVGYAGFKGLRLYKGQKDLFDRTLEFSRTDVVDSLATSAVLTMGEGNECQPIAVIKDAPVVFTSKIDKKELYIDPKEDLYGPLFKNINKLKL